MENVQSLKGFHDNSERLDKFQQKALAVGGHFAVVSEQAAAAIHAI